MLHLFPILGLACMAAAAPPDAVTEAANGSPETVQAAESAGLKVVVDPETGEIIDAPTELELARLSEHAEVERRRSAWDLRGFSLPAGGRGVFLDGWADRSLAVRLTPDGEFRTVCSHGEEHGASSEHRVENDR